MAVPKHRITIWPSNSTSGHIPVKQEIYILMCVPGSWLRAPKTPVIS